MQIFTLSQSIQVEKRTVMSLPGIFGKIGGLYAFLAAIAKFFIGRYQSGAFSLQQVGEHYRIPTTSDTRMAQLGPFPNLSLVAKLFMPLSFGPCQQLKFIYWPCCKLFANKRDQMRKQMISKGEARLGKALDTRTIVRFQRNMRTWLKLEMSQAAQKLLRFQRHDTVIDLKKHRSSSDENQSACDVFAQLELQPRAMRSEQEQKLHRGVFYRKGILKNRPAQQSSQHT